MKEYSYQQNKKYYERRVRMLYACSLLLVVGAVVIMYLYVGKWLPVVIVIGCGAGMIGIMRLLQRNDDVYISQIVAALSDLLDSLSELERQEVFPENEDTLLSKLQSKTDKMVTTLRLQNERERAEHENIPSVKNTDLESENVYGISEKSTYHNRRETAIFTYLRSVGGTFDISFGKHDQSIEIGKWSDHIAL